MLTAADVQKSYHYLYPAELPALKLLAASLPSDSLVVNIGAGSGTSGLAFMESRPDLFLLTIDIENNDSPLGSLYSEREVMKAAGYGGEMGSRWVQLHGDSSTLGRAWQQGALTIFPLDIANGFLKPPGMVFIDGDHSYEGCKADIEAFMPLLLPGGILACHDFLKGDLQPDPNGPHPKNWPGVDSAVQELLIPNFEIILHVASLVAFRK